MKKMHGDEDDEWNDDRVNFCWFILKARLKFGEMIYLVISVGYIYFTFSSIFSHLLWNADRWMSGWLGLLCCFRFLFYIRMSLRMGKCIWQKDSMSSDDRWKWSVWTSSKISWPRYSQLYKDNSSCVTFKLTFVEYTTLFLYIIIR